MDGLAGIWRSICIRSSAIAGVLALGALLLIASF
jgi:hypothetical protein